MGDNENWRSELDIAGLSLIDEDDSLLLDSFPDPTSYGFSDTGKDDRGLNLFGDTHNCDEETLVSTLEEKEEDALQSHESPEPQKIMKYNLRKSLAWDKAFFTNEGVLEPDELSTLIESNHMGERKVLPTIQEDVNRSTESISTLHSDFTVEASQEFGLFEDVRASIQRSAISSDAATPDKGKELRATEAAASPTPSTLDDPGSQEKIKPNVIRKRSGIKAQGLGKVIKQPVATKEHSTPISRPPKGLIKSVRASEGVNKTKQENKPKLTGGKEPLAPRVPISRRTRSIVSKPVVPFKSALRSSIVSKNELTSSCSSLESCVSISSSASNKSSLDSVKQKKAQSLRTSSHSLTNASTSRAASRNIGQPKVPPLSASRTYKSKLSSNVSPFSSSVDWSSESPRASTTDKLAKDKKKTVPGESAPAMDYTAQTVKLLNNSKDVSAVKDDHKLDKQGVKRASVVHRGTVRSAFIMKPTGLRVPSPKVGYFDGARTSDARTPTGSCSLASGLAKHGTRNPNESNNSRTTSGKSQPSRSPLIQESTNSKAKSSPASRSPSPGLIVSASASSLKLTNKIYSKVSAEEQLKDNEAEDNVARW